jgi:hypothetical protein
MVFHFPRIIPLFACFFNLAGRDAKQMLLKECFIFLKFQSGSPALLQQFDESVNVFLIEPLHSRAVL